MEENPVQQIMEILKKIRKILEDKFTNIKELVEKLAAIMKPLIQGLIFVLEQVKPVLEQIQEVLGKILELEQDGLFVSVSELVEKVSVLAGQEVDTQSIQDLSEILNGLPSDEEMGTILDDLDIICQKLGDLLE